MRRFVGKAKIRGPAPTLGDASERLGTRGDTIDQKIAKLERELAGYKKQMKTTRSAAQKQGIKQRAMQVLKRKKMYEQQRDQLGAQQFNIDQQSFAVEGMQEASQMVRTMKTAQRTMKTQIKKINIDQIEDLQDDMAELMIDADEVQNVMGREYGTPLDLNEDDLDAELEMLDDFDFEEEEDGGNGGKENASDPVIPDYLKPSAMPTVPNGKVAVPEGGETDEFGLPIRVAAPSL